MVPNSDVPKNKRSVGFNTRVYKRKSKWFGKDSVKLRAVVGAVERKNDLNCAFLNVDGLSHSTLEDVKEVLSKRKPDLVILVETKRREEELGLDIAIDGYAVKEIKRSDAAEDKGGGGIAYYTRLVDGLVFHEYNPEIELEQNHFVNKERVWVKVKSASIQTAVCGAYFGFQSSNDHNAEWNSAMYETIHKEEAMLRAQGFRIIMMADFNGHVGNVESQGIQGNHKEINPNGRRLLEFLKNTRMHHVNGHSNLTRGLWTRQRGKSKTVLDYTAVSEEHLHTVKSLEIDDKGKYGGGSDHNWMFLAVEDKFVRKKRVLNACCRKPRWKILDDQDWSEYQEAVRRRIIGVDPDEMSRDGLANCVAAGCLEAGKETIGLTKPKGDKKSKPKLLTRTVIEEIKLKRKLENEWKSSVEANGENTIELEEIFIKQKQKVNDVLFSFNNRNRGSILKECTGKSPKAVRCFWNRVSTNIKQDTELSAVVNVESGTLKCTREEIDT